MFSYIGYSSYRIWSSPKKIKKINYKNWILFVIALSAYLNNFLYFYWDTYKFGRYRIVLSSIRHLGWIMMVFYAAMFGRKPKLNKNSILILVELITTAVVACYMGSKTNVMFNVGYFIAIMIFLSSCIMYEEDKAKLFDYLLKIFVVIVLPGMIYYIITVILGIDIPFSVLESDQNGKTINGVYYELRPMGLIMKNRWVSRMPRYTGVFDEPGVVGTFAGLFLATIVKSKKYRVLRWIVLLEGLLSFSFAFYIFLLIMLLIWLFQLRADRTLIGLLVLGWGMFVFINANIKNEQLKTIRERFDFQSGGIIVDNRTSQSFDERFYGFPDGSIHNALFGYGFQYVESDESLSASYSYKILIMNHGYLGALLYIGFFLLVILLQYGFNRYNAFFSLVFLASIYQRPYVINQQYLLVFLSALSFIWCNSYKKAISD